MQRIVYQSIKITFWLIAVIFFRFTRKGAENFPTEGGALVCGNHQSYFDPILIGISFRDRLNFLARKTLFDKFPFGTLIGYLDAIPIDREGMSLGGLKESLKRLRRGEMLMVFPEGTRSENGEVGQFKPGFVVLARRGKAPILPVAIDGAYDAWPRDKKLPRFTKVCTVFGPQISAEEIRQMSDDQLVETLRARIIACLEQAHELRGVAVTPKT